MLPPPPLIRALQFSPAALFLFGSDLFSLFFYLALANHPPPRRSLERISLGNEAIKCCLPLLTDGDAGRSSLGHGRPLRCLHQRPKANGARALDGRVGDPRGHTRHRRTPAPRRCRRSRVGRPGRTAHALTTGDNGVRGLSLSLSWRREVGSGQKGDRRCRPRDDTGPGATFSLPIKNLFRLFFSPLRQRVPITPKKGVKKGTRGPRKKKSTHRKSGCVPPLLWRLSWQRGQKGLQPIVVVYSPTLFFKGNKKARPTLADFGMGRPWPQPTRSRTGAKIRLCAKSRIVCVSFFFMQADFARFLFFLSIIFWRGSGIFCKATGTGLALVYENEFGHARESLADSQRHDPPLRLSG